MPTGEIGSMRRCLGMQVNVQNHASVAVRKMAGPDQATNRHSSAAGQLLLRVESA
jgi:hypothetical protein